VAAPQVLPIDCLASGETATIVDVDGDRDAICRLAEIGFRPGVSVRMLQAGRPCILAMGNHRLTYRGEETATVFVEVAADNRPVDEKAQAR